MRKKIALKYCGGCDPDFDRVQYFEEIRTAAGDSVEWVTLDDRNFETILVICGCDTACAEDRIDGTRHERIVTIRTGNKDPSEIAMYLLSEGAS